MDVVKKSIPGYDDYIAYSDGRVYSKKSNKFLKPSRRSRGYYSLVLYNGDGARCISRHRLICSVFNPVKNMSVLTVDHLNGKPGDDRSSNLEFVTVKENVQRYFRKYGGSRSKPHPVIVLFLKTNTRKRYRSVAECARDLSVHKGVILFRLHSRYGMIFPDMTMIKYESDDRDLVMPKDIGLARSKYARMKSVLVKDIWSGDFVEYASITKACANTGINISILSDMHRANPEHVYIGRYIVRTKYSTTDWPILDTIDDKLRYCDANSDNIRMVVINDVGTHVFMSCVDAAKYLNIKPTALSYRLTRSDCYNCYYLSEYKHTLTNDGLTIHYNIR